MSRILKCNNEIVDSIKLHNPKQLVLFYELLRDFKRRNQFDTNYQEREELEEEMEVNLDVIKEWLNLKRKRILDLEQIIEEEMKVNSIKIRKGDGIFGTQVIFDSIWVDLNENVLKYTVNKKSIDLILEESEGKFSILQLIELSSFRSKYSQRMYELYVRYKNMGSYNMKIQEFKTFFNVPECFKSGNIDQIILKPIFKEMNKEHKRVELEKIKKGKEVTHFKFTFDNGKTVIKNNIPF